MPTVRKAVYILSLTLVALFTAVFAYNNQATVPLDIGFMRFGEVSIALAFAMCFAFGWIFGLITVGTGMLRMAADRRRLRRALKLAEAEVSSLRSLPLQDAD